jgi:hypothetical protein
VIGPYVSDFVYEVDPAYRMTKRKSRGPTANDGADAGIGAGAREPVPADSRPCPATGATPDIATIAIALRLCKVTMISRGIAKVGTCTVLAALIRPSRQEPSLTRATHVQPT